MIKKCLLMLMLCSFPVFGVKYHQDSRGAEIHTPFRWIVADSTARMALSVAAADTQKFCFQLADTTIWCLIDNSPKNWAWVSGKKVDSLVVKVLSGAKTIRDSTTFTGGSYFSGIGRFAGTLYAPVADIDSLVGDVKFGGNLGIGTSIVTPTTNYKSIKIGNNQIISRTNAAAEGFYINANVDFNGTAWVKPIAGRSTVLDISPLGINFYFSQSGSAGTESNNELKASLDTNGILTTTTLNTGSIKINGGSYLTNFSKGTFVCSLFVNNNTDFVGYGTVQYSIIDSVVTLRFPFISGTITTSGTSGVNIRNVPAALRSSKTQQYTPVSLYENGGYNIGLFSITSVSLRFTFITSASGSPATGTFAVNRGVVQYFL